MMSEPLRSISVWPEGGITGLEPNSWHFDGLPSMREIAKEWQDLRTQAGDSRAFQISYEEILRLWSVETGEIEGLYDIERGVTETLLTEGFDSSALGPGATDDPERTRQMLKDHREALDLVFAFIKTERELSVGFIHELHAALTQSQSSVQAQDVHGNRTAVPLTHGKFKTLPNYPRRGNLVFEYCPPEQTASEMDRLVAMAQGYLSDSVPPEVLAAWLHHRFTQIHPYQDGNGRVARALATIVLVKAGLGPFTVDVQNKARYLDRLEDADRGDLRPLVLVVAREQDRILRQIKRKLVPTDEDTGFSDALQRIEAIARLHRPPESLLDVAPDFLGRQVVGILDKIVQEVFDRSTPSGKVFGPSNTSGAFEGSEALRSELAKQMVLGQTVNSEQRILWVNEEAVFMSCMVVAAEPQQTATVGLIVAVDVGKTRVFQKHLIWEASTSPLGKFEVLVNEAGAFFGIAVARLLQK